MCSVGKSIDSFEQEVKNLEVLDAMDNFKTFMRRIDIKVDKLKLHFQKS